MYKSYCYISYHMTTIYTIYLPEYQNLRCFVDSFSSLIIIIRSKSCLLRWYLYSISVTHIPNTLNIFPHSSVASLPSFWFGPLWIYINKFPSLRSSPLSVFSTFFCSHYVSPPYHQLLFDLFGALFCSFSHHALHVLYMYNLLYPPDHRKTSV